MLGRGGECCWGMMQKCAERGDGDGDGDSKGGEASVMKFCLLWTQSGSGKGSNPALNTMCDCDGLNLLGETPWGEDTSSST